MLRASFVVAIVLFLSGCATTQLSNVVLNPDFQGPIHSVMILGAGRNEQNRAAFEQQFASLFERNGVRAIQSRNVVPRLQAVTEEQIREAVLKQGVQTVLTVRVVDVSQRNEYVPPHFTFYRPYWDPFYYGVAVSPGFIAENTTILVEVTLQDAAGDQLVWSATSASTNPTKLDDVIDELGRTVVEQFRKNGLL